MCGRIVWVWDAKTRRLLKVFDERRSLDDEAVQAFVQKDRYNVPPTSDVPVVSTRDGRGGVEVAHWGFPVPKRPDGVFNTRIETAAESPLWRGLVGRQHALMVVKGFYEWTGPRSHRQPHFLQRRDGEPMVLAGLAGTRDVGGRQRTCVSVVTCAPSREVAGLHDRMPVILEKADAESWLRPDPDGFWDLARPAEGVLAVHRVDDEVNRTSVDHPGLIEPTERPLF